MVELFSSQIIFSIVCFSLGIATIYRAARLWIQNQGEKDQKAPHFPMRLAPGFQLPSMRRMVYQASKIISVISFAMITAAVLMVLLGYMPLSF